MPNTPNTLIPQEHTQLVQHLDHQKRIDCDTGDTPFDSQDTQKYFYFLVKGRIKISQLNFHTNKEQTLSILSRGDMYDVITLLDQKEHTYLATALEPTTLIQVPIEHIRTLLKNSPEFHSFFLPYLAKQLRDMESLVIDLSLYDVYERTIRLLVRHVDTHPDNDTHLNLIDDLSHEELASLLGTVRKVLNRNLQKLKQEGIIDTKRKQLSIKDMQKLFDKINLIE